MIKAIDTQYKGYLFRSRLEARWAVFFDALGLKWEYEPEGFELPDGIRYLPDFKITSPQGTIEWYEIKPEGVTSDRKTVAFSEELYAKNLLDEHHSHREYISLLSGDPVAFLSSVDGKGGVCPRCGSITKSFCSGVEHWSDGEVSIGCFPCDMTTPCGGGHPDEDGVTVPSRPHKGMLVVSEPMWQLHLNIVQQAAVKARSARFEHGAML